MNDANDAVRAAVENSCGVRLQRAMGMSRMAANRKALLFIATMYPVICGKTLSMLSCESMLDGSSILRISPIVRCDGPAYKSALPVIIAAVVAFPIGIPFLVFLTLYLRRRNHSH